MTVEEATACLADIGQEGEEASLDEVRKAISLLPTFFKAVTGEAGLDKKKVHAMCTKFRDAGRRSPPWKPTSTRVPGRPQDGADGNRRKRWLFEPDHKFYADERTASLVEIRFYFQALSMVGAPPLPEPLETAFSWLTGHPIRPGEYLDPIQQITINLPDVLSDLRLIQSGHLVPLDRGGKHTPENAFLMLARSNQLQGNQTLDELLSLMEAILNRHQQLGGPQEPTVDI